MSSNSDVRKGHPVSASVLDSLALEYMTSEGLIEFSDDACRRLPSNERLLQKQAVLELKLCHAVRSAMGAGQVDKATRIIQQIDAGIMKDQRLEYVVVTRKFLELLRPGTDEARKAALECLRKEVRPLAEVAYPEAYDEFKRLGLAIAIREDDQCIIPAAKDLWSIQARSETAAMLSRTARQAAGLSYSKLSLILRYLALTYRMLKEAAPDAPELKASDPEIEFIVDHLLGTEREPPPFPAGGPRRFTEANVQTLKEAVKLTRDEAIQGLKHVSGDRNKAFTNELGALSLNISCVDDLVRNCALQRELVQNVLSGEAEIEPETDEDMEIDIMTVDSSVKTDVTTGYDRGSYSSPPRKIRRWLGRETGSEQASQQATNQRQPRPQLPQMHLPSPHMRAFQPDPRRERVQSICESIVAGYFDLVMDRIEKLNPNFSRENTEAAFLLLMARFYTMAADGRTQEAVPFARAHLSPLVKNDPDRTEQMKNALADALIPAGPGQDLRMCINRESIAARVEEALEVSLGLHQPQLVQLLRVLLDSHRAWYIQQRCDDSFEELLGLDNLRAAPGLKPPFSRLPSPRVKNSGAAAAATSSSSEPRQEFTHSEDVSDADIANLSDGEPVRSMYATARNSEEDAILLIMEFTGLGRPAAMDLLAEFGGNAQEALANLYH